MQPLLSIKRVPLEISYSTSRAQLKPNTQPPRAEVTRERGRADIQTEPARIQMDSYEMRASMGRKSAPRSVQEYAQAGRAAAIEAARTYAENGNQIMDSHGRGGNPIAEIAMSKVMSNAETIMTFLPSVPTQMWAEGGNISFDFSPDRLHYNWNVQTRPEMEFVPGEISFEISQYPELVIEYLGGPIYVPRSADPNYVPPPELSGTA